MGLWTVGSCDPTVHIISWYVHLIFKWRGTQTYNWTVRFHALRLYSLWTVGSHDSFVHFFLWVRIWIWKFKFVSSLNLNLDLNLKFWIFKICEMNFKIDFVIFWVRKLFLELFYSKTRVKGYVYISVSSVYTSVSSVYIIIFCT